MSLIKPTGAVIVFSFFFVWLLAAIVRKLAYQLYLGFPNADRVCEFGRKRKFTFYWTSRADFSAFELVRLYTLWIMLRFDKYLPVIDCDRQAAKAQYFHSHGWYAGMRGLHLRYIDPKAWPVLLVRGFSTFLFPSLPGPSNQVADKCQPQTASQDNCCP